MNQIVPVLQIYDAVKFNFQISLSQTNNINAIFKWKRAQENVGFWVGLKRYKLAVY